MRRKQKAQKQRAANPKANQRASLSFRMNVLFFSIFVLTVTSSVFRTIFGLNFTPRLHANCQR